MIDEILSLHRLGWPTPAGVKHAANDLVLGKLPQMSFLVKQVAIVNLIYLV
jgi:hypothetical protein